MGGRHMRGPLELSAAGRSPAGRSDPRPLASSAPAAHAAGESLGRLGPGRAVAAPAPRGVVRRRASLLIVGGLAMALGGCAALPTIPDPSTLRAPAKEIVITDGSLDVPHEVLGPVAVTLGGLHTADLPGAAGAAKQLLRDAAYTRYGDRLDAIINVKTSPVSASGPLSESAGKFSATRGLRAEGVAIAISVRPADSREELGFAEAVQVATDALVGQLLKMPSFLASVDKHGVVIDPMLDATSGQQTAATGVLERQVADRLRIHPRLELLPFQIPRLSEAQYLLTGTMRRVAATAPGSRDAFQITLALTSMKTGTVVARASSLARDEGLDTTPTAYYRDSPILLKDQVVDAYI